MKVGRASWQMWGVALSSALLVLSGCGKGDTGPTGPRGPAGPSVIVAWASVSTSGTGATVLNFGGSKTTNATATRTAKGIYHLTFTGTYSAFSTTDDVAASITATSAIAYQAHDINWAGGGGTLTATTMEMDCYAWSTSSGSAADIDGSAFTVVMLSDK